jgi:hypothetical protein
VTKIMDRDIVWALTGAYSDDDTDFSFLSECTQILEAIERLKLPNAYEFSRAFTQRANELLIAARADGRIKNFEGTGICQNRNAMLLPSEAARRLKRLPQPNVKSAQQFFLLSRDNSPVPAEQAPSKESLL